LDPVRLPASVQDSSWAGFVYLALRFSSMHHPCLHVSSRACTGNATVGKTALVSMFTSQGEKFPKTYSMVRPSPSTSERLQLAISAQWLHSLSHLCRRWVLMLLWQKYPYQTRPSWWSFTCTTRLAVTWPRWDPVEYQCVAHLLEHKREDVNIFW